MELDQFDSIFSIYGIPTLKKIKNVLNEPSQHKCFTFWQRFLFVMGVFCVCICRHIYEFVVSRPKEGLDLFSLVYTVYLKMKT